MNVEQLEKVWNKARCHRYKVGLLIIVVIVLFVMKSWIQGYMSEKGRQAAIAEKELKNKMAILKEKEAKNLKSQFPAGYQMFGIIEKQIVPDEKASSEDIKIDWSTAKVVNVTKDYIDIMLPYVQLPGNNVIQNVVTRAKNQSGYITSKIIVINKWTAFLKILESSEDKIVAVVGYAKIK